MSKFVSDKFIPPGMFPCSLLLRPVRLQKISLSAGSITAFYLFHTFLNMALKSKLACKLIFICRTTDLLRIGALVSEAFLGPNQTSMLFYKNR